jgi:hypothetical protein
MKAIHVLIVALTAMAAILLPCEATAVVTVYFNPSQVATPVASGPTWDTISSQGYLFTYTRDKLFTGGGPNPIGRPVMITWPTGVEAQFITTPTAGNATITVQRVDGGVFDLTSFTAKLLANAGAGRAIEIVPMLNGQEPFPDPFYFDVTGVTGQSFSYDTSPNPLGTTAPLVGYDTYMINLTLDYALTALTLTDPSIPTSVGTRPRTPAASDLLLSPNPADSRVQISLNGRSSGAEARLSVYSVRGARVRSLMLDGTGRTIWDLRDDDGLRVAAGVYFVRMESGARSPVLQRVVVVR